VTKTLTQLELMHPGDGEGYQEFLEYADRLFRVLLPIFIQGEPPSFRRILRASRLNPFRFDGLRSMQRAINSFVESPYLRQVLGRFATYVGASPFLAPATLNVIAHVELNQGIWYPLGGMYRLAEALAQCASDIGVDLRAEHCVEQILLDSGRVTGVQLENGDQIQSKVVVANVDARSVYQNLLAGDPNLIRCTRKITQEELSSSGFIMLLGIKGRHQKLAHHNVFFSPDYRLEFRQIFKEGIPPTDPTIYVAITSKKNASDAPIGSENWFVMVNVPAETGAWDWTKNSKGYRELLITKIAERGFDIEQDLEEEHIVTPVELAKNTGAWKGALYGASSNDRFAAFRRPHNRASYPHGLYLAGGTVHPGGGVPLAVLSAGVASRLILSDLGMNPDGPGQG
jgi:phytoene desaturase